MPTPISKRVAGIMIMKIVFIVPISFTPIESLLSVQWGRRMSIGNSPPESQRKLSIIRLKFPDLYPSRERVSSVLLMQSASPEMIIRCSLSFSWRERA